MTRIHVAVEIDATPEQVWEYLQRIDRHVDWMRDAVAIHFVGEQTSGVGTEFVCDTKVGPLKLADRMTITHWVPAAAMGVRHDGVVSGEGMFTLTAVDRGTRFAWEERLKFAWWLGGPVAAIVVGQLILRPIWKRNLRALKQQLETAVR